MASVPSIVSTQICWLLAVVISYPYGELPIQVKKQSNTSQSVMSQPLTEVSTTHTYFILCGVCPFNSCGKAYKQHVYDKLSNANNRDSFLSGLAELKNELATGKTFPLAR